MALSAKVDNVRADYDVGKDTLTGAVDFSVSKSIKLKARYTPHQIVRAEVAKGKAWSVAYDIPKKNLTAMVAGRIEGADIKLTQSVPNLEWNVVPSPELEISTKLVKQKDWNDRLKLNYDFRTRKGSITEKVYMHKIHKVSFSANNTTKWDGATYLARSKLGNPYCHNLGLRYSIGGGPVLRYKIRPNPRLKVKTETAPKPQTFTASMMYRPELKESADVGLNLTVPFGGSKTKDKKSSASVLLRWKF